MWLRKVLISLTLLALVVPGSMAQDQTSKPDSSSSSTSNSQATAQSEPPVQQPDDSKIKHDGSKNDVDAIGNRKIGVA